MFSLQVLSCVCNPDCESSLVTPVSPAFKVHATICMEAKFLFSSSLGRAVKDLLSCAQLLVWIRFAF